MFEANLVMTAAVAAAFLLPAWAVARAEARRAGACAPTSRLKLSREDGGRVETEFQVDQNRAGVHWIVTVRRDGEVVASTNATTKGPSGSFAVRPPTI